MKPRVLVIPADNHQPRIAAAGAGRLPDILDAVRPAPGFWGDRIALSGEVTMAHCQEWMEREGWIGNFRGELPRRGREDCP